MQTFDVPFANAGDKAAIPVPAQGDGSVSYTTGFTLDYEAELGVDPNAKPVPRDQTNQVLYEVTDALGQTMKHGYMPWQAGAYSGGFPINARVYHNGKLWQSIVANNTVEPTAGNAASWADVSRVIVDASETDKGVARFATLAEHRAGVALDLMTNPAGVTAMINNLLPRHLGQWSTTSVTTSTANSSWVRVGSVSFTARAGRPVQVSGKTVIMMSNVGGDEYIAARVVVGATVIDVTSHNVITSTGQYSQMLYMSGRLSLAAGNHTAHLEVYKNYSGTIYINASDHGGLNLISNKTWLQVDEGAQ